MRVAWDAHYQVKRLYDVDPRGGVVAVTECYVRPKPNLGNRTVRRRYFLY